MKFTLNPTARKVAIWLGLAIVALIIFNQVLRTISKAQAAKDENQIRNDLDRTNLSYDLTQYAVLADKLEESIGSWSTDENAVYTVFRRMSNDDDVKQLIKSFGERTFTYLTGAMSLTRYINAGMSEDEIEQINKILADKDINISF